MSSVVVVVVKDLSVIKFNTNWSDCESSGFLLHLILLSLMKLLLMGAGFC